jgi:hypothetical protein
MMYSTSDNVSVITIVNQLNKRGALVLCVCFVDRYLSFRPFSFGHCIVCSFSIYGFWLPPFGIFKLFFLCFSVFILFLSTPVLTKKIVVLWKECVDCGLLKWCLFSDEKKSVKNLIIWEQKVGVYMCPLDGPL